MSEPEKTLITFPPSLDSELSRFLLQHYEVPHREVRHTLIFSCFATLWHGLTILFPLVYGDGCRLTKVRAVIDHFDPLASPDRSLLLDGRDREQVEADWPEFNDTLAFATATFAYYHLLKRRSLMIRPLSEGAPGLQVRAVRFAYPLFAGVLRLLLRLTAKRATEALVRARGVLDAVDARLADGRRYLVGDWFSLSDMAFAVAAAPLVLPDAYGGPLPSYAEMPAEIQAAITAARARPAGRFALRIYGDHRRGAGPSPATNPG